MSVTVNRKLSELEKECNMLGLTPTPTRQRRNPDRLECSKDDYIRCLREFFINKYKEEGTLSPFIEDVLKIDEPMLALQIKNLKPEVQNKVWDENDTDYLFEEKIDGCRSLLCFKPGYGFDIYSRNNSVTDFLPISYREHILFPEVVNEFIDKIPAEFILDCELVPANTEIEKNIEDIEVIADTPLNLVTSILGSLPELSHRIQSKNPLKFICFDCIKFGNDWIIDKPLRERIEIKKQLVSMLQRIGFRIENVRNHIGMSKKEFYDGIIAAGGEGCVCKNLNDEYEILGQRSGSWVKIKRKVSQSFLEETLGDTLDAFVIGFEPGTDGTINEGLVGSIKFGIFLLDDEGNNIKDQDGNDLIHHIATVGGLSQELRELISDKDELGNVILKPNIYGMVASIDGQDISSKNRRFAHAVFNGWRMDRAAGTCKMKMDMLNKLIL